MHQRVCGEDNQGTCHSLEILPLANTSGEKVAERDINRAMLMQSVLRFGENSANDLNESWNVCEF